MLRDQFNPVLKRSIKILYALTGQRSLYGSLPEKGVLSKYVKVGILVEKIGRTPEFKPTF